jgi:hypothetical protein
MQPLWRMISSACDTPCKAHARSKHSPLKGHSLCVSFSAFAYIHFRGRNRSFTSLHHGFGTPYICN